MNIWKLASLLLTLVSVHSLYSQVDSETEQPVEESIRSTSLSNFYQVSDPEEFDKVRTPLSYSDEGSWACYGFSPDSGRTPGFAGPFMLTHDNGQLLGRNISGLVIEMEDGTILNTSNAIKVLENQKPQGLYQAVIGEKISCESSLHFVDKNHTIITYTVSNLTDSTLTVLPRLIGNIEVDSTQFKSNSRNIVVNPKGSKGYLRIAPEHFNFRNVVVSENAFVYTMKASTIAPNNRIQIRILHQVHFQGQNIPMPIFEDAADAEEKEIKQWNTMLDPWIEKYADHTDYQNLVAKCMMTLQGNWRSAEGEYKHAGLFPSHHQSWFNGFWAWDSWKHSAALAMYHPELAKDQVRTMFDHQNLEGMVPDCIFRNQESEAHNYRNTKPPLATWAVKEIYDQTGDVDFVAEMMPKLLLYHNWWNKRRNYVESDLFSYGSEDATMVAAKWESGMDNACRFDGAISEMYRPQKHGRMRINSVDLNCYLWWEEQQLDELLKETSLGKEFKVTHFFSEPPVEVFWEKHDHYFFDVQTKSNYIPAHIEVYGPEGWSPLFTKACSQEQADHVVEKMMDPAMFNTHVPFPTLSADHKDFSPERGYWRGPVWIDQAYFAIKGMRNYGFDKEANEMTIKLLENCDGILGSDKPLRENYNPLTGDGLNAKHFSWTAACILLLLEDLSPEAIQ